MTQRRIDVHFHYLPDFYLQALIAAGQTQPDGIAGLPGWSEADMIATMDVLGVERAYLSISSPGIHFGDDAAARRLARQVNEEGARLKLAYPGRIGYLAPRRHFRMSKAPLKRSGTPTTNSMQTGWFSRRISRASISAMPVLSRSMTS